MVSPDTAFTRLLGGDAEPRPPDAMDYADADQIARAVDIDGEMWIILLRRGT